MAVQPSLEATDRASAYAELIPQVRELLRDEKDAVSAMANFSAVLMAAFRWHWVGFYRVIDDELVLGPFQGPVACARIGYGKGVCGAAWKEKRTVVVPDVDAFPGHIACSPHSRSEIVVPLMNKDGQVVAVLDIDSSILNDFDPTDASGLGNLCLVVQPILG